MELDFYRVFQKGCDVYIYLSSVMVCSRYPKEYRFYETVLKRKCFKKLRNNVWENKTKWILIKKADSHYREKLLYKYINLWVVYLNECFKKKISRRAADAHYEEKLKTKVILALRRNVERSWMLLKVSRRKFEFSLKYKCWHEWKHYVQKRLKMKEVKMLADRIREERLRIRFFYTWLFRLNEKRLLKDGYKLATVKHETKLKEKCFKYWKIFTKKQICKSKIEKLAIACYKDKLKEKYIRCWKNYVYKKKRYMLHVNVIQKFYENYLIKNYLNRWLTTYRNMEHQNQIYKFDLAVNFYDRKLLKKGFETLWKSRVMKKERKEKMQKFRDIYVKIYVNFYLNVWCERKSEKMIWNLLENKAMNWRKDYLRELFLTKLMELYHERTEEREELENVIKYFNAIIIHRAFRGWRQITDNKIQKRIQLENATKVYLEALVKKSFEKWKKFVLRRSRKKMAAEYYKFILLLRLMTQWKIFFKKRKLKLAKTVILERKHNIKLLKNAFECWKNETEISKSKLNVATYFYDRSNLLKAFHKWRKNIQKKTVSKACFTRNKAILNDIIIKNTIFRWYEMLTVKQNFKKKLQGFQVRKDRRALALHFSIWHKFVEKIKCVNQNKTAFTQVRSSILIEQYLVILLEAVASKKVFNKKEELAGKTEEKLLKRKYLKKWLSFISWKREKIQKCISEEKKFDSRQACEFFILDKKSSRRQPMIPDYLRAGFDNFQCQEENTINQETYRIQLPINKNLPVIGSRESFVSFEI